MTPDSSDADSDVLADYVLALLRHEQSESDVKQMCVDQLEDFLHDSQYSYSDAIPSLGSSGINHFITPADTRQFVNDLFNTLRAKSFLSVNSTLSGGGLQVTTPSPAAPKASPSPTYFPPAETTEPTPATAKSNDNRPKTPEQNRQRSKKRPFGYIDRDSPSRRSR